jgi:hypothetical protein
MGRTERTASVAPGASAGITSQPNQGARGVGMSCLYQTASNVLLNKPARTGIKGYDPICFDNSVLSREVEDQVVQRVKAGMRDFPGPQSGEGLSLVKAAFQTTRP